MWSTKNVAVPLLLVLLLALISLGKSDPIISLPDYSGPNVTQYSGYITVDQKEEKALFYWLIESLESPSTAPLVVWYQGGPGCSSMFGLFVEHGPFRPNMQRNRF
jgi:serine carboxypeptidase-like clade 2